MESEGPQDYLYVAQMLMLAGAILALEVVLIWAATLLFSRRLHPGQRVIVAAPLKSLRIRRLRVRWGA